VIVDTKSKSHTMILLVEVGNEGTGIVACCQCMRRGRLLVWLTVACVGFDGDADVHAEMLEVGVHGQRSFWCWHVI